jgi:hypothetical protein
MKSWMAAAPRQTKDAEGNHSKSTRNHPAPAMQTMDETMLDTLKACLNAGGSCSVTTQQPTELWTDHQLKVRA